MRLATLFKLPFLMAFATAVMAQETGPVRDDITELKLKDWQPRSMLVTERTDILKPAFPVIDVHNHLGAGAEKLTDQQVRTYLRAMDDAGVQTVVNLDGGWDTRLRETLAALDERYPKTVPDVRVGELRGHRRGQLVSSRGTPAGTQLQGGRRGA